MGKFSKLIYLLGAYQIGKPVFAFGYHNFNYSKREELNNVSNEQRLKQQYGAASSSKASPWAIVTGGSEGIGREFVLELAKSGFNVVICSRSIDKLATTKADVESKCPDVEIRVVPIDFSKTLDYSSLFYDKEIAENLRLIVNNVGYFKVCKVFEDDPEDLQRQIKVNLYPVTLLSKFGINSFKNQQVNQGYVNRFGLVSVSSYSAIRHYTTAGVYGGTKRYDKFLGHTIDKNAKTEQNIDSMVLAPGLVSTGMVGWVNNWYNTCLPNETARGTLRALGFTNYTHGSFIHMLWAIQIGWTPEWIRNFQRKAEGSVPTGTYNALFHI